MERVLLTGGSGFFGRRIAEALRRHGFEVATPGRPDFNLLDSYQHASHARGGAPGDRRPLSRLLRRPGHLHGRARADLPSQRADGREPL